MKIAFLLFASLVTSFAAAADHHATTVGEFSHKDSKGSMAFGDHGPVKGTIIAEFHTIVTKEETEAELKRLYELSEKDMDGNLAKPDTVASVKPCFLVRVMIDNEDSDFHDPNTPVEIMTKYQEGLNLRDVHEKIRHVILTYDFVIPLGNGDQLISDILPRWFGQVKTTIESDVSKGELPTSVLRKKLKDYTNDPNPNPDRTIFYLEPLPNGNAIRDN